MSGEFDWTKLLRLRKYSVQVSSSLNSLPLFVIVFWGKTNRSSLSQMFFKIVVLKNFANFIGKHLLLESLFNEVVVLRTWNFFKNSNTGDFLWNLKIFEEHHFFTEHLRWLLLIYELQRRKNEISPVYVTKVTGLQRKKSEKKRMAWDGECPRLRRRCIN